MKKNLIKITAAAFAVTMALGSAGVMAYADEPAETPDETAVTAGDTPTEEAPADAPEETPTDAPEETPTDAPEETPTEAPTEIAVTTIATEISDISTQTTAAEDESQVTTAVQQDKQLLTSGSWRSENGLYTFDPGRASGAFKGSDGTDTTFVYTLSPDLSISMSFAGGATKTGVLTVSAGANFTITWSDGTSETFSKEDTDTSSTTTSANTSSSSNTTKSSSSAPAGKTDSPKTGDDFHALPLAALALTGTAVCFMSFRKREDD